MKILDCAAAVIAGMLIWQTFLQILLLRYKALVRLPVLRSGKREGFLVLANSVQNIKKISTGNCPHGLPLGACPICSNSAGSLRESDKNRKIGEMTYHECAMIGAMLKARALAQKNHEANMERRVEISKIFESQLTRISENLKEFAKQISNSIFLKPIAWGITNIVVPIVNFIKNTPVLILNFLDKFSKIKQKIIDITDKLTAIIGEIKNFIQKKVAEIVSVISQKLKSLFRVHKRSNSDDDDTKIDDDKKIFNLKTVLNKVKTLFKKKENKKDKKNDHSHKRK